VLKLKKKNNNSGAKG